MSFSLMSLMWHIRHPGAQQHVAADFKNTLVNHRKMVYRNPFMIITSAKGGGYVFVHVNIFVCGQKSEK